MKLLAGMCIGAAIILAALAVVDYIMKPWKGLR